MKPATLVAPLADGALDIVGDVHGEIDALEALLAELGYAADGTHPDDRRLVFVGDLVDRGPDSPAVLWRVQALVEAGRAQCIIGNHELNLLRNDEKHGNSWWTSPDKPARHPAARVSRAEKAELTRFLESLPVVLERDDLRVVHACWNQQAVDKLRELSGADQLVADIHDQYQAECSSRMAANRFMNFVRKEWARYQPRLDDPDWDAQFMPALAELGVRSQMENPVKVLTAGEEEVADAPFWAGGRWRMTSRVKWWERYADDVPVVFGHYWRRFSDAAIHLNDKYGPDLFAGIEPHHWMGKRRNVYCVDFSVGARAEQRANDAPEVVCKLSALRLPEAEVVHDDGERVTLE